MRARAHRNRFAERGLTIVEIVVAMAVLGMATVGSLSWTVSSMTLESVTHETNEATSLLRQIIEEMQGLPFNEVFARHNADPADDPGGPGTCKGATFTIPAHQTDGLLDETWVDPGGGMRHRRMTMVVTISFPVDGGGQLLETVTHPAWGNQAWDLNMDGTISGDDMASEYGVLPVLVRLAWTGGSGSRAIEAARILSN